MIQAAHQIKKDLEKLYKWYALNHRPLAFRKSKNFYSVWVSEIMLQQTRVAAMEEKYIAFMNRFPDISSLAASEEGEVMDAWSGLGYYTRAKNLRRGAQYIIDQCGGEFPEELDQALKIPGVGPYTAAAVLSISKGKSIPVLDGNVRRILARYFYSPENIVETSIAKKPESYLIELSDHPDPGIHNQAIMELGAMICIPANPLCKICPLESGCKIYKAGGSELAGKIPEKKREVRLNTKLEIYRIGDGFEYIILRDAKSHFFRNLWFFPHTVLIEETIKYSTPGLNLSSPFSTAIRHEGVFKHSITSHQISVDILDLILKPGQLIRVSRRIENGIKDRAVELVRVEKSEIDRYVVSSIAGKMRKFLEKNDLW